MSQTEDAGTDAPRIVRAGPSSLNGAPHPAARDAPAARRLPPGDLCQPSGPDGEGQATGQARFARGESLQLFENPILKEYW